jgi:hypothetical protein
VNATSGPRCGWLVGPRTPPLKSDTSEVGEGVADRAGDRRGVWRSISRQDQPIDGGRECQLHDESPSGGRVRGRGGSRPGGTREARCWPVRRREPREWPTHNVVDKSGVGEASHTHRRGRISEGRGSGPPATVVGEGEVDEASHARQRSHTWCLKRREQMRRGHIWHGQRRKAGHLGWRGNRIRLKERVKIGGLRRNQ